MHCLGARGGEGTGQRGEAPPQGWGAASAIPRGQGLLFGTLVSAPNELWQGHSTGSSAMLAGFQSFSFPSQFFFHHNPTRTQRHKPRACVYFSYYFKRYILRNLLYFYSFLIVIFSFFFLNFFFPLFLLFFFVC